MERNQVVVPDKEVARALKFSKSNKAPGSEGIPIELLKYGGKKAISFLTDMFNEIFSGEDMPQEWNSAYIYPTYKERDNKDCKSQMYKCYKFYWKSIYQNNKNKTENVMKAKVSEEQVEFTAGKSCSDNILCLQQLITEQREKNKETHNGFCGFRKGIRHDTKGTAMPCD